jgi:hypothetical protein
LVARGVTTIFVALIEGLKFIEQSSVGSFAQSSTVFEDSLGFSYVLVVPSNTSILKGIPDCLKATWINSNCLFENFFVIGVCVSEKIVIGMNKKTKSRDVKKRCKYTSYFLVKIL